MQEDSNPVSPDSLNRMMERKKKHDLNKARYLERLEEYKVVVNRLFSTPDGKYFLNDLIDYCGIHSFDQQLNPAKLVEDAGKRKVFLEMIRPHLDKTILMELN